MKKAGIYIRCAENAPYRELQEQLKTLVEKQGDWQFTEAYVDVGYSGRNLNRPALQRLIADCKAGNVEIIIVKHFASLSRNVEESLRLLDTLQQTGIAIYQCAGDALEPIGSDPALGAITEQVKAMKREANKRYEEKHKAERKDKSKTFSTSMPRRECEEILDFLRRYKISKVDLIFAGYAALKTEYKK